MKTKTVAGVNAFTKMIAQQVKISAAASIMFCFTSEEASNRRTYNCRSEKKEATHAVAFANRQKINHASQCDYSRE